MTKFAFMLYMSYNRTFKWIDVQLGMCGRHTLHSLRQKGSEGILKGCPHQCGVRGKCIRPSSAKCVTFELNFINFESQLSDTTHKLLLFNLARFIQPSFSQPFLFKTI